MFVCVKELLYWKTEHMDGSRCQDAPSYDGARGLFAVADGAGTSLFPALWSRILARHFLQVPLMSDNPFEIEWWVRLAQNEYKRQMPALAKTAAWNVRQKMQNQSSDSTLATLRITDVDASSAEATLLVFGDSCVLVGYAETQQVRSFVLQQPADFERAPICIPSTLKFFNRDFHRCALTSVTLHAGDTAILATDAVSKWILSRGDNAAIWSAFQSICELQPFSDWYRFIDECRARKEMVDDDCTAIVLQFGEDGLDGGIQLHATTTHDGDTVVAERQQAFEKAVQDDNKELIAIYYGDGADIQLVETNPPLDHLDIGHAREVANALKEVLRVFRQAQNTPHLVAKVGPVWNRYKHLLQDESCAANLRETLKNNGVPVADAPPPMPAQTPPPSTSANSVYEEHNQRVHQTSEPIELQETMLLPLSTSDLARLNQEKTHSQKKQELELVFLRARYDNNDPALAAAYEAIRSSEFPELLDSIKPEDRERAERVHMTMQKRPSTFAVASVNGREIGVEQYRRMYFIQHLYINYKIHQIQTSASYANKQGQNELEDLSMQLDPVRLSLFALSELIESLLIQDGIAEEIRRGVPADYFDLTSQVQPFAQALQMYEASYDGSLLSNDLSAQDQQDIFLRILQRELFAWYLDNQQSGLAKINLFGWSPLSKKSLQLEHWLKERREQATITYGDEPGLQTDLNLRQQWLLTLLFEQYS